MPARPRNPRPFETLYFYDARTKRADYKGFAASAVGARRSATRNLIGQCARKAIIIDRVRAVVLWHLVLTRTEGGEVLRISGPPPVIRNPRGRA